MNNLPFDKPGRFWRGNLHTHSTRSDGARTPEQVCDLYRLNGYDFLALTDHFIEGYDFPMTDTRPFRTDSFTTLIGAELHTGKTELGDNWHILAVGLPLDFAPPPASETGPQIAQRALDAGAYVAAAHPQWFTLTEADVLSLGDIHAIETYNAGCAEGNDRADSWYMLDVLLARGYRYNACATDDAHIRPDEADSLRAWVQVKAESLDPDALLDSLKRGWYYSSTGPLIHDVTVTDEEIIVRCSPVERIFITGRLAHGLHHHGLDITEVRWPRSNFRSSYARVTIRDDRGGRAWTNPFWLDE